MRHTIRVVKESVISGSRMDVFVCLLLLVLAVGCTDSGYRISADAAAEPSPLSMDSGQGGDAFELQERLPHVEDVFEPFDGSLHRDALVLQADPLRTAFAFPIHPDDRAEIQNTFVIGVDHDPVERAALDCRSFSGRSFPTCYDGHAGTDFLVWGGFDRTDVYDVRVVAAAPGTVVRVEDGHYDRCHGDLRTGDVSCDGYPMRSNRVHIRHDDGMESRYLHLKRDSLTVALGDSLNCGQVIGLVGSSGRSAAPHLHFEVVDAAGNVLDPYEGPVTMHSSYWTQQDAGDGMPGSICTHR